MQYVLILRYETPCVTCKALFHTGCHVIAFPSGDSRLRRVILRERTETTDAMLLHPFPHHPYLKDLMSDSFPLDGSQVSLASVVYFCLCFHFLLILLNSSVTLCSVGGVSWFVYSRRPDTWGWNPVEYRLVRNIFIFSWSLLYYLLAVNSIADIIIIIVLIVLLRSSILLFLLLILLFW